MRAVVWEEPGKLAVTEVPDPTPGHAELIVEVGSCGICGTDVHIADGEFPPTPYPIVPGHEFAGQVVALGEGVPPEWHGGERGAVDPSLFCGHCEACHAGRGNLCANWNAIGDTVDGAFAEFVKVPAANAYKIPDAASDQQGALIEPLSCAVHGMRRLGSVVGEDVLVMGAGTMGLLLMQLLNRAGARSVSVVDRKASRLDAATATGATAVATDAGDPDTSVLGGAAAHARPPAPHQTPFPPPRPGRPAADLRRHQRRRRGVAVPVPHLQRRDRRPRLHGRPQQLRRRRRPHG